MFFPLDNDDLPDLCFRVGNRGVTDKSAMSECPARRSPASIHSSAVSTRTVPAFLATIATPHTVHVCSIHTLYCNRVAIDFTFRSLDMNSSRHFFNRDCDLEFPGDRYGAYEPAAASEAQALQGVDGTSSVRSSLTGKDEKISQLARLMMPVSEPGEEGYGGEDLDSARWDDADDQEDDDDATEEDLPYADDVEHIMGLVSLLCGASGKLAHGRDLTCEDIAQLAQDVNGLKADIRGELRKLVAAGYQAQAAK